MYLGTFQKVHFLKILKEIEVDTGMGSLSETPVHMASHDMHYVQSLLFPFCTYTMQKPIL